MTILERIERKRARLRERGHVPCDGVIVVNDYHSGMPCSLGGTMEYEGKIYCKRHYPPALVANKEIAKQRRVAWLKKQLQALE